VKKRPPYLLSLRVACIAYLLLLTFLLVVPEPLRLFGITQLPGPPSHRGAHFVLFAPFGLLAMASRWPLPRPWLVGTLLGYAVLTELIQACIPNRAPELFDVIENILGLAAGMAVCWLIGRNVAPTVA
jgi:VanZ family protein